MRECSRLEECSTCSGTGVRAGTTATTCSTCGGQGQVVQAMRTPLGMFQQVSPGAGGGGVVGQAAAARWPGACLAE